MKTITVNKIRCPENHACPAMRYCPENAMAQEGYSAPTIDADKCIGCGKCVRICPMQALQLKDKI